MINMGGNRSVNQVTRESESRIAEYQGVRKDEKQRIFGIDSLIL
jgi:hypothetical protein